MAREENTADGFPDKSEFIPPAKIRKKPDCDRKTLIPDPCDLRVDRRKKTEENNDCNTEPVVQVCPEDLGKFRIPELPVIPPVFVAKRFEPLIVPRLPDPPPPDSFCNDPITEACPSDGWLDADWAEENINTNVVIERDEFGGVKNVEDLQINVEAMPDDPKIFIPVDPERKEFGGSVTVDECSFVAATKEEANKKAKIYAIESLSCEFCSPEVKVDCEDLQSLALPIGGIGYTAANTNFVVTGDGVGASLSPQINEHGSIVGVTIDEAGEGYTTIAIAVEGDGEGAVVGRVLLDNEDGCGGAILEVEMGQTLPDPGYDPEVDPPIKSKTNVCVPPCAFSSTISQEDADDQARTAALAALDCYYQSKELNKPCTPPTIPKDGYDLPLGAFTTRIDRGTQASVDAQAKQILDALECIEVTCPDGFPGAEVDIQIIDPNDKCNNSGGGSNPSTFGATFDEANCMYKLDGTLVMPEIPCPCGFTTTSSVSQGAGGNACDAPSWSPTTIYGFDCGYENWVATKQYRRGNTVQFNGNVYTATSAARYDRPSDPNSDWEYVSPCVSQPHKVKYNYRLYENTTWSKGDVPGKSSAWNYLGRCGTPPPHDPDDPDDPDDEQCGGSIDLGVIVSGGGADFDFDIETCSFDFNLELPSVQLTCESITFSSDDIDFTTSVVEADAFGAEIIKKGKTCVSGGGCGLELELPDFELQLNVPCPDGFTTSSDISVVGGNVTGGPGLEITATQCESNIDMDLEDCVLTLEGEICIPDLEINLDIECPEGITASSTFTVTATGRATAEGDLTATIENCALELDGYIDIDVPNVLCEDGITVASDVTVTGSGSAEVSGDITASINECDFLLEGAVEIFVPNIPCPEGMTASSSVVLNTTGRASGGGTITAEVQNCEIVLDGILEVDVPEIPCPQGITASGSVPVTTSGSLQGGGSVQLDQNNCDLQLLGSIDLFVPEIPCPDGITASGTATATGSGMAEVSGDVTVEMIGNCDITLTGGIDVFVPEVQCKDGITGGGSVGVSGGGVTVTGPATATSTGGGGSVDLSVNNCAIELSGAITMPDIEIDINIPCPEGITAGGDIDISGGTISGTGPGLTVTRTGNDSSSVGITMTDCALEIDGTIVLPTYEIEVNIPCPDGMTGGGSVGMSGGGISLTGPGSANLVTSGSSSLEVTVENCDIQLSGDLVLPEYVIEINVECPDGITAGGSSSIRGTGMAQGEIELSIETDGNCGVLLYGDGDIHVPNIECKDGISGGGSVAVTGGSFDASGDGVTGSSSGGGGSVDISVNNCAIDVSGSITLPDITVSVENPCYEGVTTSGSAVISGSGAASGTATIELSESGECGVALSGGGTIHVPEASCPDGITAGGSSSIRGTGFATGSVEISIENDGNCGVLLYGDGDIHVPNVECADGISGSGSATISGSGIASGTATIELASGSTPCDVVLSGGGSIQVDDPGWCLGIDGSGSAQISGSGAASGGGSITLSQSGNCGLQLSGSADIYVPEASCPDGISGGGSVSVDVSGEATGGGQITLEVSNCDVTLSGSVSIDVPAPNIACEDVSGALCDGDFSTMTLTVCGAGGATSSITVLTM